MNKLYLILLLTLVSFGTKKASAQKKQPLSEPEQIQFDIAFINGNKEKILENFEEALKQFRLCYKIDPDNAALNFVLGETYYQKKQVEDAEKYVVKATQLDPKNYWYKDLLVDVYLANKRSKDAALLLIEIGKERKNVDYFMKAAYVYSITKDYKAAIKVLNEAEKIVGVNEDISTRKEQIFLAQNKVDNAIKEIEKLIKAFPTELKFKGMLADLYWANDKTAEAVKIYEEIITENPANGFAAFALADYHKAEKQYDEWYNYVKRGMASSDVSSKLKLNVLSTFIGGNEFTNQQERTFELATIFANSNAGDPLPYLVLGDVYQQQKNYDSARYQYRQALLIEPSMLIAWQQTIFCSSQLLNNNYLLADSKEAIEYYPTQAVFFVYAAIASAQLKAYSDAISFATQGLDIATADQEDLIFQLQSTLADAYHYSKNYVASDSLYESLIQADSNNVYALNNYAYFLSLRKNSIDKAEKMSKKTIEVEPENASYLDTYGWILFTKGNYTEAKQYIEKSLKFSPNNAEVLDHLGDVFFKLNDIDSAVKMWQKAKELGSQNPKIDLKIKDKMLYEQE